MLAFLRPRPLLSQIAILALLSCLSACSRGEPGYTDSRLREVSRGGDRHGEPLRREGKAYFAHWP